MKFISSSRIRVAGIGLLALLPLLASAQATDVQSLFSLALEILNDYIIPIVFAIAFIVFLIGIYRYFIQGGGNDERVKEGRTFLLWSIIGFVIMFSIWGIINLFLNTLGFGTASQPGIPTFTNTTGTTGATGTVLPGSPAGGGTVSSTGTPLPGSTLPLNSNGTCNAGYVVQNGVCVVPSQTTGAAGSPTTGTPGDGTVLPGGSCSSDDQCDDTNGSFGCYQGTCTPNGDAPPADGSVSPGGACTTDDQCDDTNGSFGCYQGTCTPNGDAPPADGSVSPGGACTTDDQCEDIGSVSYGCYQGACTENGDAPGSDGNSSGADQVSATCDDGNPAPCVTCSSGQTVQNSGECVENGGVF